MRFKPAAILFLSGAIRMKKYLWTILFALSAILPEAYYATKYTISPPEVITETISAADLDALLSTSETNSEPKKVEEPSLFIQWLLGANYLYAFFFVSTGLQIFAQKEVGFLKILPIFFVEMLLTASYVDLEFIASAVLVTFICRLAASGLVALGNYKRWSLNAAIFAVVFLDFAIMTFLDMRMNDETFADLHYYLYSLYSPSVVYGAIAALILVNYFADHPRTAKAE